MRWQRHLRSLATVEAHAVLSATSTVTPPFLHDRAETQDLPTTLAAKDISTLMATASQVAEKEKAASNDEAMCGLEKEKG